MWKGRQQGASLLSHSRPSDRRCQTCEASSENLSLGREWPAEGHRQPRPCECRFEEGRIRGRHDVRECSCRHRARPLRVRGPCPLRATPDDAQGVPCGPHPGRVVSLETGRDTRGRSPGGHVRGQLPRTRRRGARRRAVHQRDSGAPPQPGAKDHQCQRGVSQGHAP